VAGSLGTLVGGLPMAHRRPDLFPAYLGTDFYVNMLENERIGRRGTVERVRAPGNRRVVAALERIGDNPQRGTSSGGRSDRAGQPLLCVHPSRGLPTGDAHAERGVSQKRRSRCRTAGCLIGSLWPLLVVQ
jgi:hypothetical protein